MPYDKSKPYSCPCCGYWNGDMKEDYYKHKNHGWEDEKIKQFNLETIELDSYKDVEELKEFDYLLVPLESVEQVIRNYGTSSDECDEICIKKGAPIMFANKGQKI